MKIQYAKYSIPNNNFSKRVTQFFEKIFVVDPAERISTFQLMDLIAREANLPNPYKDRINEKDPEPSMQSVDATPAKQSSSSKPKKQVQQQQFTNEFNQYDNQFDQPKQQVHQQQSSFAGSFWDDVSDVPTETDESLKREQLFKPKISGENVQHQQQQQPMQTQQQSVNLFDFDQPKQQV